VEWQSLDPTQLSPPLVEKDCFPASPSPAGIPKFSRKTGATEDSTLSDHCFCPKGEKRTAHSGPLVLQKIGQADETDGKGFRKIFFLNSISKHR
jgi:hypothetical protein